MTKPNSSFKNIALLLTVTSGLAFNAATPQTANAASYHNGVPKVLRGKWRSGIKTYKYGKIIRKSRAHAHFYKKSFSNQGAFYPDPNYTVKVKYKSLGHKHYKLVGYQVNNAPKGGIKYSITISMTNSKKMKIKFNQSSKDKWNNTTYYKY